MIIAGHDNARLGGLGGKGRPRSRGRLRHARYHLNVPSRAIKHVTVNARGELAEG